jgi:hypothetical protein
MNRGPMVSTAISPAWLSIRPLVFACNPQQKRRAVNPKLKPGIGALLLGALLGAPQVAVAPLPIYGTPAGCYCLPHVTV